MTHCGAWTVLMEFNVGGGGMGSTGWEKGCLPEDRDATRVNPVRPMQ